MLVHPGDLIPVQDDAIQIPWTRRKSQILRYQHKGSVTFETFVYDTNVGDISSLSTYFNPERWTVDELNHKFAQTPDNDATFADAVADGGNNCNVEFNGHSRKSITNPYLYFGPHGYKTYPHSRCPEVPTVDANLTDIQGEWNLIQVVSSHDGKPFNRAPYLCPESRIVIESSRRKLNISQISYEWPLFYLDVVEWIQHPKKLGIFWHEENIFSLWTMKIMEFIPQTHMVLFLCIDYTLWPGWNHRGVYVLSKYSKPILPIKRKLSKLAHKRMKMDFNRFVNTTVCNPNEYLQSSSLILRWHPHKKINGFSYRAPVHPYISRKHRRNLKVLD